jgi:hypothetical protein
MVKNANVWKNRKMIESLTQNLNRCPHSLNGETLRVSSITVIPYSYIDKNGRLTGFHVETLKLLGRKYNYQMTYKPCSSSREYMEKVASKSVN